MELMRMEQDLILSMIQELQVVQVLLIAFRKMAIIIF